MEKKPFSNRIKSMSLKKKLLAIIIILLIVAIPIGAVAYQLNQKNSNKTNSKNSKNNKSNSKNANGLDGKSQPAKRGDKSGGGESPGGGRAVSRLDRFNKDSLSKRIDQALQGKRITEAQAKTLQKKLADIEKFVNANKSKNLTDQSKVVADKRKELFKWARDNDIPSRYVAGWL